MRRLVIATLLSLCVCSLASLASGDTLTLRDGTRMPGTVVAISDRIITFEDLNGISHRYSTNQVETLEFAAPTRRDDAANRSQTAPRTDSVPSFTRRQCDDHVFAVWDDTLDAKE